MTSLQQFDPYPLGLDPALVGLGDSVPPRDRYRGALVGAAIGDALGRPAEGRTPDRIRSRYGMITDYVPWRGWRGGPKGTITDDTQMTMCVAASIIEHGDVDGADLAERFVDWLPVGRGKGQTCVEAIQRLQRGYSWMESGIQSAGNGAAMRVAPIGLRHVNDLDGLRRAAFISAIPTHADRLAVLSAILQSWGVAYCAHRAAGELDPQEMLWCVETVAGELADTGAPERKPEQRRHVVLTERLEALGELLDAPPEVAFALTWNGAFVLESLPAAWWSFLSSPEDPERIIVTAVDGGYDADTVASMAGALAGAYHGYEALPTRWVEDLEFHDELMGMADRLHALAEGARLRGENAAGDRSSSSSNRDTQDRSR